MGNFFDYFYTGNEKKNEKYNVYVENNRTIGYSILYCL
jgi:hypothetical protein